MSPTLPCRLVLGVAFVVSFSSAQTTSPIPTGFSNESIQRFHDLAPSIIKQANLKAGQAVIISGSPLYMPFVEDIAIQLTQLGVRTLLDVQTDKLAVARRLGRGESCGYAPPTALDRDLAKDADLRIAFPDLSGPGVFPAISPQQQLRVDTSLVAWRQFPHGRRLFINIPTERDTAGTGLSFAELSRYRWNAMQADYSHIAQVGESLRRILAGGKTVRVTSPEGTDITFALAPNSVSVEAIPSVMNDARIQPTRDVSIPGGHISANIISRSANGEVRVALDQCSAVVRDEAIDVHQGLPENVHAGSDEACVQKTISGLHLNTFVIGLNPALAELSKHSALPFDLGNEGTVALWFGGNWQFGGTDYSAGIWYVSLPKASVSVDGKPILRDGQLVGAN